MTRPKFEIRRTFLSLARLGLFLAGIPAIVLGRMLPVKNEVENLVVKVDALGDFVLSLGFVRGELHNQDSLLISGFNVSELASLAGITGPAIYLDQTRFQKDPMYRFRMLCSLSRIKARKVSNLQRSRVLHVSDQIVLAIRSKNKVGLEADLSSSSVWESAVSAKFYNSLNKIRPSALHETEFLSPFSNLYGTTFVTNEDFSEEKFLLISLSASSEEKTFPPHALAEALAQIRTKHTIKFVGDERHAHLHALFSHLESKTEWLVGKTDLGELVRLVSSSAAVISSDSLVGHLAQHFQKPYLVIRSGVHWGRFFPYPSPSPQSEVIPRTKSCSCDLWCSEMRIASPLRPCLAQIPSQALAESIERIASTV